jgi:23S rRNA U2552 (ribose-2'-O)-methylase RlmE/FtsJ
MTYYLIPRNSFLITKNIDCIATDNAPNPIISNSLSHYLYNIKEKIDKYEKDWDIFKKYTNPYEYIHTVTPGKKKSISIHKPLSRSYFKMIEIINTFSLNSNPKHMKCFHLAEGPGGFIEALIKMRNNKNDSYIGMTILDKNYDSNIPAWKKSENFLKQNENVYIESGSDDTGNILSLDNFKYCKENYSSIMDFITADGGFDFSFDFNSQEVSITKLLFAQICFALVMQKKGGTFVLKIFDCFMEHSLDLIYILSSFYDKVYIMKPQTSRYANSEKYLICKGFLYSSNEQFYSYLFNAFEKMVKINSDLYIDRFLSIPISYYFLSKIEELNAIFGQQQIENIHYTISLIENKHKHEKINNLIKINIKRCIQWCIKNNINYNNYSLPNESENYKETVIEYENNNDYQEENIFTNDIVPEIPSFLGLYDSLNASEIIQNESEKELHYI